MKNNSASILRELVLKLINFNNNLTFGWKKFTFNQIHLSGELPETMRAESSRNEKFFGFKDGKIIQLNIHASKENSVIRTNTHQMLNDEYTFILHYTWGLKDKITLYKAPNFKGLINKDIVRWEQWLKE